MLTTQQRRAFDFIQARMTDGGVAPSINEIKDHLGLRSKSFALALLRQIESRGFIRRLPRRARGIEIIERRDAVLQERQRCLAIVRRYQLLAPKTEYETGQSITVWQIERAILGMAPLPEASEK